MTGYCGTCRVHFTTADEWAEHQHQRGLICSCGRSFAVRRDYTNHLSYAWLPTTHTLVVAP
jgi:hypothetical protein